MKYYDATIFEDLMRKHNNDMDMVILSMSSSQISELMHAIADGHVKLHDYTLSTGSKTRYMDMWFPQPKPIDWEHPEKLKINDVMAFDGVTTRVMPIVAWNLIPESFLNDKVYAKQPSPLKTAPFKWYERFGRWIRGLPSQSSEGEWFSLSLSDKADMVVVGNDQLELRTMVPVIASAYPGKRIKMQHKDDVAKVVHLDANVKMQSIDFVQQVVYTKQDRNHMLLEFSRVVALRVVPFATTTASSLTMRRSLTR